jgi:hypothetical protein
VITDAGRQNMADVEAKREERREAERAARAYAREQRGIDVGDLVAYKATGVIVGMVIDQPDPEHLLLLVDGDLATYKAPQARNFQSHATTRLQRVAVADVEVAQEANGALMHRWARRALLVAAMSPRGLWTPDEAASVRYALSLVET